MLLFAPFAKVLLFVAVPDAVFAAPAVPVAGVDAASVVLLPLPLLLLLVLPAPVPALLPLAFDVDVGVGAGSDIMSFV